MIIRAACDMEAGTEVTFRYSLGRMCQTSARAQQILDRWGFVCDCAICEDDRIASAAIVTMRSNLLNEAKSISSANYYVQMQKYQDVLEKLDSTYYMPADVVPRLHSAELADIAFFSCYRRDDASKCLE